MNNDTHVADLKMAVYLFHPELNAVTKKYSNELKKHYARNTIIINLINLASTWNKENTKDHFLLSLKEMGVNDYMISKLYEEYEKIPRLGLDLIDKIKGLLRKIIADQYVKTKEMNSEDSITYIKAIQDIDLTNLFDLESSHAKIITESSFGTISISAIEEQISKVIPSFYSGYNRSSPFNGYLPKQLILVSAAPGTGKSLFLMNEARHQVKNHGRKCLYAAIGDLNESDFLIRMAAQELRIPMSDIPIDLKRNRDKLLEIIPALKDIKLLFINPGELTPKQFVQYLESRGYINEYDSFFIDYDSNFLGADNLYQKGDEVYSELLKISNRENKLVFVASQPIKAVFTHEEFGKESVGESSRKIHIPDVIITIGRCPWSVNPVGVLYVAKNRRGNLLRTKYFLDINGEFIEVNDGQYAVIKNEMRRLTIRCNNALEADQIELEGKNGNNT